MVEEDKIFFLGFPAEVSIEMVKNEKGEDVLQTNCNIIVGEDKNMVVTKKRYRHPIKWEWKSKRTENSYKKKAMTIGQNTYSSKLLKENF